ncbi:MAG: hypothetical protein JXR21_05600 [Candidatus Marinimicrobia bacterium]|nr:hypothetical protein [Candidatus Neomarinimicrobiota bacterium]
MDEKKLSYPLDVSTKEALKEIARGIPCLLKLFYRLLRDERTPREVKWWIGGSALYLILPINLKFKKLKRFPLQVLNYIDDVVVVTTMIQRIFKNTPDELLEEHWDHDISLSDWRNLLFKIKTDIQNII